METVLAEDFPGWGSRSLPPPLGVDEAHAWLVADLAAADQSAAKWADELRACLSPEERAAERRFHRQRDRDRFAACRGILRRLAGCYLDCAPARIRIVAGEFGKPEICGGGLQVNVSHSHGLALLGFCREQPVGIDVERMDPAVEPDRLVEHVFSSHELRRFRALPEQERLQGFYNGWTRKEAFIKATGRGLDFPLAAFDVSLEPGAPAQLLRMEGSRRKAAAWGVYDLPPIPGFAAALVIRGARRTLSCFSYPASARVPPGTGG
jgi:4'-phosphopantetheinyl transferase